MCRFLFCTSRCWAFFFIEKSISVCFRTLSVSTCGRAQSSCGRTRSLSTWRRRRTGCRRSSGECWSTCTRPPCPGYSPPVTRYSIHPHSTALRTVGIRVHLLTPTLLTRYPAGVDWEAPGDLQRRVPEHADGGQGRGSGPHVPARLQVSSALPPPPLPSTACQQVITSYAVQNWIQVQKIQFVAHTVL